MGQYFKLVNVSKREVVNPWELGGVAKFWEWIYNPQTRVFPWLLRRSDGDGGGDIHDREGYQTLGRWAGDPVVLIGDYDSSGLYQEANTKDGDGNVLKNGEYSDISKLLRQEFNEAVARDGCPNMQL